ncbi:unnamed protein product [Sphenostylis stenocarpa]|uniref:Uncharacterized protein n=1 Tax=Sphenostylis stenocarpa TaxID=92480 RepID=A0AA86SP29_9FABA|nr:unnamed protein product [Sphenostylis stenocarpa]
MYADLVENGGRRSVKERLNGNGTSGLTRLQLGFEFGCGFALQSKSCRDEMLHIESNGGGKVAPTSMQDLRCQSAKNASSGRAHQIGSTSKEVKVKRGKRTAAKPSKSWSLTLSCRGRRELLAIKYMLQKAK